MRRYLPALAVVLGLLAGFLLSGCTDATGPTEVGVDLTPTFKHVYQGDASGGGGGGGASGSGWHTADCSSPTASQECWWKFVGLVGGAGALTACGAGDVASLGALTFACGMGALGWGQQAHGYLETPDCRPCMEPGVNPIPSYPTIGPDPHRWDWDQ